MLKTTAMTRPKMAITIQSSSSTIRKKMVLVRGLMYLADTSEIDLPWFRSDMTKDPKSCTAPMTMVPTNTQIRAGTQPQMMAIAGPTMGPVHSSQDIPPRPPEKTLI